MNPQVKHWVAAALTMVIMPWSIWVTMSIFNQRQEIALLKLSNSHLKEIRDVLTRNKGAQGRLKSAISFD